jgi:hypothetical protein
MYDFVMIKVPTNFYAAPASGPAPTPADDVTQDSEREGERLRKPRTRLSKWLAKIAGVYDGEMEPKTEAEYYLNEIAANGDSIKIPAFSENDVGKVLSVVQAQVDFTFVETQTVNAYNKHAFSGFDYDTILRELWPDADLENDEVHSKLLGNLGKIRFHAYIGNSVFDGSMVNPESMSSGIYFPNHMTIYPNGDISESNLPPVAPFTLSVSVPTEKVIQKLAWTQI